METPPNVQNEHQFVKKLNSTYRFLLWNRMNNYGRRLLQVFLIIDDILSWRSHNLVRGFQLGEAACWG